MSAINERVSPETLDKIIEAADEVITALAGTNEDVHKNDSAKMCQLWDDLNDRYATPAIVKALAAEIKQYRAAAEPMYQAKFSLGWRDVTKEQYDDNAAHGAPVRIVYAAPQVTSVPDEMTYEQAREITSKRSFLVDRDSPASLFAAGYNACRMDVYLAAPAVQAEQLSGNTEQVSQLVLPEGYALVPIRLTAENGAKGLLSGEFSETKYINCPECFGDDECETCDGSGRIEITVPVSWTTIKEIWAKGVEHFAAAPKQEAE